MVAQVEQVAVGQRAGACRGGYPIGLEVIVAVRMGGQQRQWQDFVEALAGAASRQSATAPGDSHLDDHSLSYCRMLGNQRVVAALSANETRLTYDIVVWSDGVACSSEVSIPA